MDGGARQSVKPPDAFSLEDFPLRKTQTRSGQISYRESGSSYGANSDVFVLLHGIGSSAASWVDVARNITSHPVVAWDAPGYGESTHFNEEQPSAQHYARAMWEWLDAMEIEQPITLVGHSLGALMAASACVGNPLRVERLLLLSPAQGYGNSVPQVRAEKANARLELLHRLGPEGMARERGLHMCSVNASAAHVAFARWNMAQVNVRGYTQATHMLMNANIAADLVNVRCPITIANGDADTITPPENARALAAQFGANYASLGNVGHACAIEDGLTVAQLIGV